MADSNVAITAGSGTNIDTRTAPDGDHRQVMVIGDGTTANTASVNSLGSLLIQGAQSATTSVAVTTSSTSTGTLSCLGYNVATVTITGTYAGINLTFELSLDGGTTWVPVNGAQLDAATVTTAGATGVITSNASRGWDIAIGAADSFRVRSTAFTSGSGAVKVAFQTLPYEPAPVATISGTVAVSGTVTATASGTYNLGTPAATPVVATTGDTGAKTATGNGATVTNANGKGAIIVVNLGTVTGTTPTAVFKLQGSADSGTTWFDIPGATTASLTATGAYIIEIYPGLTAVAGVATAGTMAVINGVLPRSWRVVWTIGGTTPSFTITNVQVNYLI